MRDNIKKILKESEEWFDQLDLQSNLPFEIAQNPRNRPKITNMFIMKTGWDDGGRYLREDFNFNSDEDKSFEWFMNVCKFYSKLLDNPNEYGRWKDVDRIAKSLGLSISSYDEDNNYGTPKDMSDYIFGVDDPAVLHQVEISYFDKGGVEYDVKLK